MAEQFKDNTWYGQVNKEMELPLGILSGLGAVSANYIAYWSSEIGSLDNSLATKFDKCLSSSAAETLVEFHSNWHIMDSNLKALENLRFATRSNMKYCNVPLDVMKLWGTMIRANLIAQHSQCSLLYLIFTIEFQLAWHAFILRQYCFIIVQLITFL